MRVLLTQVGTVEFPGIGFYSLLYREADGFYYDTDDDTFKDYGDCVTPEIPYVEGVNGEWSWELTLTTETGAYTVTSHDSLNNTTAAEARRVWLVDGESVVDMARTTVALSEDTGGTDNLRYVDSSGAGIESAIIRVFDSADYVQGSYAGYAGMSVTDSDGRWAHPVNVEAGHTYVVTFQIERLFGVDTAEVTV